MNNSKVQESASLHPNLQVSSIAYNPTGTVISNSIQNHQNMAARNRSTPVKKKLTGGLGRKRGSQVRQKRGSQRKSGQKENMNGRGWRKPGRNVLRNSYYMMHHTHIFYRELARENADFERNYQKSVKLADRKIQNMYRSIGGNNQKNGDRGISKNGDNRMMDSVLGTAFLFFLIIGFFSPF